MPSVVPSVVRSEVAPEPQVPTQGAGPDKARAPAVHSNSMVYPRRPTQVAAGNLV